MRLILEMSFDIWVHQSWLLFKWFCTKRHLFRQIIDIKIFVLASHPFSSLLLVKISTSTSSRKIEFLYYYFFILLFSRGSMFIIGIIVLKFLLVFYILVLFLLSHSIIISVFFCVQFSVVSLAPFFPRSVCLVDRNKPTNHDEEQNPKKAQMARLNRLA